MITITHLLRRWQQLFPASKSLPPALFPVLDLDGILKPVCHPSALGRPHCTLFFAFSGQLVGVARRLSSSWSRKLSRRASTPLSLWSRLHTAKILPTFSMLRSAVARPSCSFLSPRALVNSRLAFVCALLQLEIRDYNKLPPKLRQYAKKIHEMGAKVGEPPMTRWARGILRIRVVLCLVVPGDHRCAGRATRPRPRRPVRRTALQPVQW